MPTKPDKFIPALYGGIIIAVISAVPGLNLLYCLCCANVMIGGLMAVYFYKNNLLPENMPLDSSDSIQLGLLAGVFGAVIGSVLSSVIQMILGNVAGEMINKFIDRFGNLPPEFYDKFHSKFGSQFEEGLTLGRFILKFVGALIIYPIFGLFGGLIGFSMFRKKQPPISYMPPMPPSMPPPQPPADQNFGI